MASSIASSSSLPLQQGLTSATAEQLTYPAIANAQSYHSAPSSYQTDVPAFSQGNGHQYGNNFFHNEYSNSHSEQINWEPKQYSHEYESLSTIYGQPPSQLTPLPSPNQCDKCGFFCESAVQLNEHCRTAHAAGLPDPTEISHQHYNTQYNTAVTNQKKTYLEHEESSAILYLDSHMDVYQGNGAEQRTSYDKATSQLRNNHYNRSITMMHYDKTLHKNAFRTPGQADPATMPISTHHYPSCDSLQSRVHQQTTVATTIDGGRSVEDNAMQPSYGSQGFDSRHRGDNLQSLYMHLPQGNIESNFSNNPLATLQNQVGSHPINIGSQPPGLIHTPTNTGHLATKDIYLNSNPPNGGAGPSVTPNHHMRELLSVSTNNTVSPVLTQNTAHPLPSFSHLVSSTYNTNLGTAVSSPTPASQLYINQNCQKQDTVPSHPNGNAPHVTATLTSNQLIVNPVTSDESAPHGYSIVKQETSTKQTTIRLPSFSECFLNRGKESVKRNVEGKFIDDKCNEKATKEIKIERFYNGLRIDDNKENFGGQTISPDSTHSNERRVQSNEVIIPGAPLTERNPIKDAGSTVSHMCNICSKNFSKSSYLTQHNNTFHSGDRPYKCGRCGKRFRDEITYKNHYMKHTHIKPFKCPECPKSYNHKADLLRHMYLHSGSKPYACEECGKGFIRQDHMINHLETHKKKYLRLAMSTSTETISSTTTS